MLTRIKILVVLLNDSASLRMSARAVLKILSQYECFSNSFFFFLSHHALALKAHLDCVLFKIILFLLFYLYLFIFICDCTGSSLLCAVLSLGVARGATLCCSVWASHCSGFSYCGAHALDVGASVVAVHRFSNCGPRAHELQSEGCGDREAHGVCWGFVIRARAGLLVDWAGLDTHLAGHQNHLGRFTKAKFLSGFC